MRLPTEKSNRQERYRDRGKLKCDELPTRYLLVSISIDKKLFLLDAYSAVRAVRQSVHLGGASPRYSAARGLSCGRLGCPQRQRWTRTSVESFCEQSESSFPQYSSRLCAT